MGASFSEGVGCCGKRGGDEDGVVPVNGGSNLTPLAVGRSRDVSDLDDEEEARVATDRERMLSFVEEPDVTVRHSQLHRFYSAEELGELEDFMENFKVEDEQPKTYKRSHTLVGKGYGPWGIGSARGGTSNAWDSVDATGFNVRGTNYLNDKRKVPSSPSLAEVAVVDIFMSEEDVERAAECEASKTVQRLRRDGETRRLLVLNFRLVPMHVVIVFALPPAESSSSSPGRALLDRFYNGMSDAERNTRLKVIPRLRAGPWPIRKLIGENSPCILAKGIPVEYFRGENELEISVSIAASAVAKRVSRAIVRAGSAVDIELVVVLEGKDSSELPEQILGGFRVIHADVNGVRKVEPSKEKAARMEALRPSFLPST